MFSDTADQSERQGRGTEKESNREKERETVFSDTTGQSEMTERDGERERDSGY